MARGAGPGFVRGTGQRGRKGREVQGRCATIAPNTDREPSAQEARTLAFLTRVLDWPLGHAVAPLFGPIVCWHRPLLHESIVQENSSSHDSVQPGDGVPPAPPALASESDPPPAPSSPLAEEPPQAETAAAAASKANSTYGAFAFIG